MASFNAAAKSTKMNAYWRKFMPSYAAPGGTVRLNSTAGEIRRRLVLGLLFFPTLLVVNITPTNAQTPAGSIVGTVMDVQNLAIADATVILTSQDTNASYSTQTSSMGAFQFSSLNDGMYRVSISKTGFRVYVISSIKLDASTQYSVPPVVMALGPASDRIVVEAGAESVNSSNAEVTGTVEKKQINDLPILDRNPLALLSLEPGVANSGPSGAVATTINGQRTAFSNLTLDGINIQDNFIRDNALDFSPNLPFLSQVQEFTITQQNGDVEKTGSSSVSMVTPKGTNEWHGEGFWYYRTNAWKANDWFNAASGVGVPRLLQNQGGGNIGGPVRRDKLFIYGYYELLRLRAQTPINTVILSPAIQAALAAETPTLPFTYQPFDQNGQPAGGPITQDLLSLPNHPAFAVDPTSLKLIQRVPVTANNSSVGDGVNLLGYRFNARNNNSRDNFGLRADYNLNSHHSLSAVWSYNRNYVDRPDIDTSFDKIPLVFNDDHIKFLSTAWRWSPKATLTNEVRLGFNLAPGFFLTNQKFSSGSIIDSAGFPFTGPDPNFQPQGRKTNTWAAQDNATWVRGNHVVKFGTQLQRVTIYETNSAGILPDLQIGFSAVNPATPSQSDFPAPPGSQIGSTDFSNAQALLATAAGLLSNVSQTFNVTSQKSGYIIGAPEARNLTQNNFAFYVGDNWRITRRLTFNYGLRWEYFSPVDERNGLVLLPVIPAGSTAAQTLLTDATIDFAGGNSKRGLYNPYWKGFSPNVALAWDPLGNGKTAVRAGFSINYVNDSFVTAALYSASFNAGLSTTNTAAPNGLAGVTISNAPAVPVPRFAIPTTFSMNATNLGVANNIGYAIDPNLRQPYVEQWNVAIQRDLGLNTSLTVSYLGNHGVGLFRAIDVNQVVIGSNGFLADFNRARSNGFLSLAANGIFDPLYSGPGSQSLTVFPNLCGTNQFGLLDQLGFINNDVQNGFIGDLALIYHEFGCATSAGFFAPNDFILGGDLLKNASFSTYHAGMVEIRRRFSQGLYFQANYVFSKVLTDYGGDQTRFLPYLDNARPKLERGRAPFDFTHQFKANFTYELPIGQGHLFSSDRRIVGLLLDGWQTGSIFTWQSGSPFSILSGEPTFNRPGLRSSRNTAVSTILPTQIASKTGVFVQSNGIVYGINPGLVGSDGTGAPASNDLTCVPAVSGGFCNPQPGQVGNLSLDAFTGPSYFDWDLSASKDFHVTERVKLTFRTEAFNVLNHPVFLMLDQNINSQQFGQSTSTVSSPRILQMSLHLRF